MFFFKRSILIGVAVLLALSGCGGGEDSASRVNPDSETARNVTAAAGSVCDVDIDGDVDRLDIGLITDARNNPASGPDDPRDADGNGSISVIDARSCVLQCTEPRCAIVGSGSESECADGCFPNGVAAGDVETRDNLSSVVLWTRAAFNGTVRFEYGTDPEFVQGPDGYREVEVRYFGEERKFYRAGDPFGSPPSRVNSPPAKVELTELLPGTQYHYRVCRDSCPADVALGTEVHGQFFTPHEDGNRGLTFGVSSCGRADLMPFVSIKNVPDRKLDFFVALGDVPYADSPADGTGVASNLQQFRKKNELVYSQKMSPESYVPPQDDNMLARARASTAFYATIDDHEVVDNFSGGATALSQRNLPKCKDFNSLCFGCPESADPESTACKTRVNDTSLYEDSLKAWHEYNPIIVDEYGETGDDRTAGEYKLYRYRTFGMDAAMFLLDTRSFRDDNSIIDIPSRTLLGKAQLNELMKDLRKADNEGVTWKFIMIPEPIQHLGIVGTRDRFEGFAFERAILLDMIETECIDNVVFIAGDIHASIVNNLTYENPADVILSGSLFRPEFQRFSTAWEISTGPIAYAEPIGATEGLFGNSILQDNAQLKSVLDAQLRVLRRPRTGLGNDNFVTPPLQQQNKDIPATLAPGFDEESYVSGFSYGWTEFDIAPPPTQRLTVTTWGIPWYKEEEAGNLDLTPTEVNKFVVVPARPANSGENCFFDKNCKSCRCKLFTGIGDGLLQCSDKLPNGRLCATNSQCDSGRCRTLICQAKEPNGNTCLTNNDCRSDRCRALRCRAKEASGNICLTNNDCRSGRCRQSGLLRRCD